MINSPVTQRKEKNYPDTALFFLGTAFLSLFLPLVLFIFRSLDDNRLTSWAWVFTNADLPVFATGLLLAILVAQVLARLDRWPAPDSLLFSLAFLSCLPFWGEPEVIVDAARYFTQAKQLATHGLGYFYTEWGQEIFAWTDLPLVPFIYGLVFKFLSEQRVWILILNSFLFAGTVLLTSRLGRLLWNEETGRYAGIMLLCIPYLLTQIPLMLVDIPTMFFLLLAVVLFIEALDKGGAGKILGAGLAFFLAFLTKYSAWILLSLHGVIVFVYLRAAARGSNPVPRRAGLVGLVALLLIAMATLHHKEIIIDQMILLTTYQKPGLGRWSEGLISTFFYQTHPFVTLAALASAWLAWRARDTRYLIIVYLVVLLVAVLEVRRCRYTIPIFPMLAIMAAYAMVRIPIHRLRRFLVLSTLCTSLLIALASFLPFLKTMSDINLMQAGRFLDDHGLVQAHVLPLATDDDIINPTALVPLLDQFTAASLSATIIKPPTRQTLARHLTSSLRFTWEYPLPDIYTTARRQNPDALVIITGQAKPVLPSPFEELIRGYTRRQSFTRTNSIFQHNTFVFIHYN